MSRNIVAAELIKADAWSLKMPGLREARFPGQKTLDGFDFTAA